MLFWRNNLVLEWYEKYVIKPLDILLTYTFFFKSQTELSKIIAKMYHELNKTDESPENKRERKKEPVDHFHTSNFYFLRSGRIWWYCRSLLLLI
jgi:hypothetical protein